MTSLALKDDAFGPVAEVESDLPPPLQAAEVENFQEKQTRASSLQTQGSLSGCAYMRGLFLPIIPCV